jgi:glucose/arabinose dehydrogenase
VKALAAGLDHPRWLYVLPNGDVLVAESNAPTPHDEGSGIMGWIMAFVQKRAGAGVPSPDRITLLRDKDGDGVAETKSIFLKGLHSPFGMALIGSDFYVANTDAIVKFPYQNDATEITAPGVKVADLPAGPIDHHWTKNIIASKDCTHLFATVGSNSNVGENGMGFEPQTGELWTSVNERDELGNDLVPDYITSVKDGGFYGWPFSYYGQHVDARVKEQRPDLVAKALVPDYAVGAHTASLGMTFSAGMLLPEQMRHGIFVSQHGSWNRKPRSGYKIIFVPFANGKPSGSPQDVLTGFVNGDDKALGRPVGVTIDKAGALLVADDVGNAVWRVTPTSPQAAMK